MILWVTFTEPPILVRPNFAATSWRKASACGWRFGSVGSVFVDAGCVAGVSEVAGASKATSDVTAGYFACASDVAGASDAASDVAANSWLDDKANNFKFV